MVYGQLRWLFIIGLANFGEDILQGYVFGYRTKLCKKTSYASREMLKIQDIHPTQYRQGLYRQFSYHSCADRTHPTIAVQTDILP
jgi:hypothetical protein